MTESVRRRPMSVFSELSIIGWLACVILSFTSHWLLGPCLFVLLAGWHLLVRIDGPPVIAAAFTFQWLQVTLALFYLAATGIKIRQLAQAGRYEPMVIYALCSITAFFIGYYVVARGARHAGLREGTVPSVSLAPVAIGYFGTILLNFSLQRTFSEFPSLTQAIAMLTFARYAMLYILIGRLMKPSPRWAIIFFALAAEMVLGFTGYFATFRESLVMIALAIITSSSGKRSTLWLTGAVVATISAMAALTWTAVKPTVRKQYSYSATAGERLRTVARAVAPVLDDPVKMWQGQADELVARIWQLSYPSLALARVPTLVPHAGGELLRGAVANTLMPRIIFPGKGELPSESDKVRKYAGVGVAGRERGTSFAFGYVAESYVDFGWPMMVLPIFTFGCLLGLADRMMRRLLRHPEVLGGVRVVFLWSAMYQFETSWAIMIGTSTSLFVVLVGVGMLAERAFHLAHVGIPQSPSEEYGSPNFAGSPSRRAIHGVELR